MRKSPNEIASNIKSYINHKNPEILQYIDNHYVDELINILIDGISIEIAKCITEKDFKNLRLK